MIIIEYHEIMKRVIILTFKAMHVRFKGGLCMELYVYRPTYFETSSITISPSGLFVLAALSILSLSQKMTAWQLCP